MTFECTQEVANDLEKLLLNNDDYDVIIYAGENENIEEIYAHSNILRARSQYFHLAFSGKWIEKKNGKYIVKKPNISRNFFKIILRFIYCGRVDLTELQGPDIIKLLIATDEINISTLSDYIQKYLIKYNDKDKFLQSLIENLESVYQHENFTELWNFCLEKICMEPDILFKSDKFIRLEAPLLELVLKRGDLSIDEIIVWDNLIKWCLAQHTNISKDPEQWNKEEITIMKRTIRRFVSLIRFNRISSEDFILKVYPFKKIIPKDLINNITLNCFYQNDSLENLFEVDIDKNQSVIELEKILKTNLDLDKVSLRKVGILISTYKRDFVFESQNMESSQKICEYFGSSPDERYIHVLICQSVEATELKHESNEMEDKYSGLRGAFLDAYLSGYLKHGDSVEYEHMGKIYNGVFRTINKSLRLIIVDHDNPDCKSFAEFIRKVTKVTDRSQRPSGNQYKKLKVKGLAWKDFCEKLRFIRSIALIKKELQYFLEDSNVRDVFFGNEFRELLKVNKLYVVVNDSPTKLLQNVGEFQIVYIVWGKFTEKVPRNLPPRKTLSPDIKKKFDELLDSTLGIEFSINHRNLIAISLGWKISKGLYTNTPAIVFYVIRKGVIPINSEIFPREICGIETDVREGFYNPCGTQEIHGVKYCQEYKLSVSPGCSIGITSCNTRAGTLGAFVENKNYLDDNIYLLSNDHVLRLKWDSETKSTIRQPAYCDYEGATKENIRAERNLLERAQYVNKNKEEIDERSENIDELKKKLEKQTRKKTELGIFVTGKRGNHDINEKTYGVDAAIALVNNPDRKRYICPKEFAVPDTVFENRSFEPIKISGIKDVHLILPSELVFKVGHTTGLTTGCIDDSLVSIVVDGDFSIYNQQSQILGEVLIDKIEMEGKEIFPSIRLDRQILVRHVDDEMFMKRGDSGCTWFDQEGKIIALGHGVLCINNLGKDYSIGSPINAVLEALEIKLYLGE